MHTLWSTTILNFDKSVENMTFCCVRAHWITFLINLRKNKITKGIYFNLYLSCKKSFQRQNFLTKSQNFLIKTAVKHLNVTITCRRKIQSSCLSFSFTKTSYLLSILVTKTVKLTNQKRVDSFIAISLEKPSVNLWT